MRLLVIILNDVRTVVDRILEKKANFAVLARYTWS